MTPGTVEMVSPTWIMKNATYSVDGFDNGDGIDYQWMIDEKGNDYGFGTLVGNIMEDGFRVPIVLDIAYSGQFVTHGNGHHRFVAALLLCLDKIPVYWAEDDYMSEDVSDTEEVRNVSGWWEGHDFLR